MKKKNSYIVAILAIVILHFSCKSNSQKGSKEDSQEVNSSEKPNIIIFFSDDMIDEYVGAYGGSHLTPNIDKLALEGVKFENAWSISGMCTPSRFSLLTGTYPGRCSGEKFLTDNPKNEPYAIAWDTHFIPGQNTIARDLSKKGYFTGFVGKWHLGGANQKEIAAKLGLTEDDDPADPEVAEKLEQLQEKLGEIIKQNAGFDYTDRVLWENWEQFPLNVLCTHHFEWMTDGAVKFVEEASKKDKPFFLYVAATGIHGPNHRENLDKDPLLTADGKIDKPYDIVPTRQEVKSRLEATGRPVDHRNVGMLQVDDHVGAVTKKLDELGIADNTIVIFASDHGVEPGKATCYDRGNKIPLIIKWPKNIKPNTVNDFRVQLTDIYPSLFDMAEIKEGPSGKMDGYSFWDGLLGKEYKERKYIYFEDGYTRAINDRKFKYIAFRYAPSVQEKMKSGELKQAPNHFNMEYQAQAAVTMIYQPGYFDADQLYDLEKDPYEQVNLAYNPEFKDILRRMQKDLQELLNTFDHPFDISDTTFMRSEKYLELTKATIDNNELPYWWAKDWGTLEWPPKE